MIGLLTTFVVVMLKEVAEIGLVAEQSAYLLFPVAILTAAWFGGALSGVVALSGSIFSLLAFYLPLDSLLRPTAALWIDLLVFLIEGAIICLIVARMKQSQEDAVAHLQKANEASDELTALQVTYRNLVESNVVGVIVCRSDGRIVDANDAFLQMILHDRTALEAGKLNWISMTPDRYRQRDEDALQELERTGRVTPYEKEYLAKDGTTRWVTVGAAHASQPGEIVAFILDITERYKVRHKLEQALEDAEAANRAKTEFLANVSHELRTPLSGIIGMTDLCLNEELTPTVRDFLQTVRDSGETLSNLINDILDFSRIDADELNFEMIRFDLHQLLNQSTKGLSLNAYEKGLELIERIDADVPRFVISDPTRVRQVIVNLVANAIKFTEHGEILVELTQHQSIDTRRFELGLKVRDTGIGIPVDDLEKIFTPFTQVDSSSTRMRGGAGLGLSICHKIVNGLNGNIRVNSEPGQGSCFEVVIPMERDHQQQAPVPDATLDQFADTHVLLVDDNETNIRMLEKTVTAWRLRPTSATSAKAAIEILQRRSADAFQVALIDAVMPDVDGVEFLRRAKLACGLPANVVLMMSPSDRQYYEPQLEQFENVRLLEKPISQSKLMDVMVSILHGSEGNHSSAKKITRTSEHTLSILVAEDTAANQKVIQEILRRRGHKVTIANNGREALQLATETMFDVIVMDMQMPTMDGFQATRMIREFDDPRHAKTPIIALTAHAMSGDRAKCFAAGVDEYLTKPIDSNALIQHVEHLGFRDAARSTIVVGYRQQESEGSSGEERCFAEAMARLGNDEALFRDLAEMYFEDGPGQLENLKSLIETRQSDEAAKAAHAVRGLVSNFGVNEPAYQILTEMNDSLHHEEPEVAASHLAALATAVENLNSRLKSHLGVNS